MHAVNSAKGRRRGFMCWHTVTRRSIPRARGWRLYHGGLEVPDHSCQVVHVRLHTCAAPEQLLPLSRKGSYEAFEPLPTHLCTIAIRNSNSRGSVSIHCPHSGCQTFVLALLVRVLHGEAERLSAEIDLAFQRHEILLKATCLPLLRGRAIDAAFRAGTVKARGAHATSECMLRICPTSGHARPPADKRRARSSSTLELRNTALQRPLHAT